MMDQTLLTNLRTAYDRMIAEREGKTLHPWKQAERARFLTMLQAEGKHDLLEIGMGVGWDSLFFQQHGLTVTCADLAPAMVEHCRGKGLNAHVVEFANLDLHFAPDSFDGVYAINCLLHVSKRDLPPILGKIRTILRPGGLFYWGQYGGVDAEGVWEGDHYEPQRFFARYTDEQFRNLPGARFATEAFCVIPQGGGEGHFHALTLRKP
jgi:cyclopropane fatty-acyl-phospholipid synthase-like methyltransferase